MQSRIPARIIQTGKSRHLALAQRASTASLKCLNPGFEYRFFDDDDVIVFIDREFPEYREVFDSFPVPIQKYDFFRYLAVFRLGGFYFDTDVFFATGLEQLLGQRCVFPFEELTLSRHLRRQYKMDWEIGNYGFGAVAGHPFLNAVIQNCIRAQQDPDWIKPMMQGIPRLFRNEFYVLNTTGPGLVSRTLAENPELAQQVTIFFPDDVCDESTWHHFGNMGVHIQEGSWRSGGNYLRRRLANLWESSVRRRLMRESLVRGKSRSLPMPDDRGPRTDDGGLRSEIGDRRSEIGDQKPEKPTLNAQRSTPNVEFMGNCNLNAEPGTSVNGAYSSSESDACVSSACSSFSSFPSVKNPVVISRSANRGIWARVPKSCQRRVAQWFGRRPCRIQMESPIISFTFDDFPRSALINGGAILRERGLAGTYYASLGLMGRTAPTGEMFEREDLDGLVQQGHELACHTFDHCDSWETAPAEFEASILRNQQTVDERLPGTRLGSLSYPLSYPRPRTKRCTEKYFSCARGGGQTFNTGIVDLNYLKAFFIEQSRDNFDAIKQTIDANAREKGWLIFATHDVCDQPTRFGCSPGLFQKVVDYAIQSKATILPVFRAWQIIASEIGGQRSDVRLGHEKIKMQIKSAKEIS